MIKWGQRTGGDEGGQSAEGTVARSPGGHPIKVG